MTEPEDARATRRQQLLSLLSQGVDYTLEELSQALGAQVKVLEEDLRHVLLSGKKSGRALVTKPAKCLGCGFVFVGREEKHLHPPSRCPKCKSEHIEDPAFRIV